VTTASSPPAFALPAALLSQGFALRPETDDDLPFLMSLYASTREEELAVTPWTLEQKNAFLAQQFHAQRHHYRTHMPDCAYDIIERDGAPVGRLYIDTTPTMLNLVDIALVPALRNQGIGHAILVALQAASIASGKRIVAFVEKFNPALRLYRRLGYTDVADHDVYFEIEWRPGNIPGVQGS
jgi:ribosomal protein S18 acetylase RimI-like enzyme